MFFSVIIPVYNRPDEIKELLESLLVSNYDKEYEIVIVEDGSSVTCREEIEKFRNGRHSNFTDEQNLEIANGQDFGKQ